MAFTTNSYVLFGLTSAEWNYLLKKYTFFNIDSLMCCRTNASHALDASMRKIQSDLTTYKEFDTHFDDVFSKAFGKNMYLFE
jgi:hypothetical protein